MSFLSVFGLFQNFIFQLAAPYIWDIRNIKLDVLLIPFVREEPEADRPNAVFHHYDDEDAYDSLKVSSDNDAYLDSNENENDVQLTQDDYFE